MPMLRRYLLLGLLSVLLTGCASLGLREPVRVTVAGLESLPGQGLEARFAVTLRVQNHDDTQLDFDGVSLDLELAGKDFGSGVSDQRGSVPRFGETLVTVPVTVSAFAIVRQLMDMTESRGEPRIEYRLRGRLGGIGLGGTRFSSEGELTLPQQPGGTRLDK
jgi:LEA14-like dessication related protein